jgi:hypothetical protein
MTVNIVVVTPQITMAGQSWSSFAMKGMANQENPFSISFTT